MTKKSAKKRNEDYYNKSKLYLKIQRDLKDNNIDKSLSELKTLTKDELKDLHIDDQILKEIFASGIKSQSDQSVKSKIKSSETKTDYEKEIEQSNEQTKQTTDQITQTTDQITEQLNELTKDHIDIVYPNWKNKMITKSIPYMERHNEIEIIIDHSENTDKITTLCGESGIGKTLLTKTIAKKLNSPLVFVGCHDNITSDDLEGSIQLLPNTAKDIQTKYVLGGIAQAIHCANNSDTKTCVLVFDEINTLLPQVQKILNNRTNFKEGIEINSIGLKLSLKDDSKIICLATCNPAHYNGTYPLNSELLSKIKCVFMEDLEDKEIITLIKSNFKDLLSSELIENVIQFKNLMSNAHKDGRLDRGIDTREVMSFCLDYKTALDKKRSDDQALKLACHLNFFGKYSTTGHDDQIKFCSETIESCFGITDLKVI